MPQSRPFTLRLLHRRPGITRFSMQQDETSYAAVRGSGNRYSLDHHLHTTIVELHLVAAGRRVGRCGSVHRGLNVRQKLAVDHFSEMKAGTARRRPQVHEGIAEKGNYLMSGIDQEAGWRISGNEQ